MRPAISVDHVRILVAEPLGVCRLPQLSAAASGARAAGVFGQKWGVLVELVARGAPGAGGVVVAGQCDDDGSVQEV